MGTLLSCAKNTESAADEKATAAVDPQSNSLQMSVRSSGGTEPALQTIPVPEPEYLPPADCNMVYRILKSIDTNVSRLLEYQTAGKAGGLDDDMFWAAVDKSVSSSTLLDSSNEREVLSEANKVATMFEAAAADDSLEVKVPAEVHPAEVQPAELHPAEVQPARSKPAWGKPAPGKQALGKPLAARARPKTVVLHKEAQPPQPRYINYLKPKIIKPKTGGDQIPTGRRSKLVKTTNPA